jgi:hypothetical protein
MEELSNSSAGGVVEEIGGIRCPEGGIETALKRIDFGDGRIVRDRGKTLECFVGKRKRFRPT